jgi:hypothetical protein
MIRVTRHTKVLMLRPQQLDEAAWTYDLLAAGAVHAGLIVEAVKTDLIPRCPSCLGYLAGEEPLKGAGLVVCLDCQEPCVALRFVGGPKGVEWFTFPWEK